jgi:CheY-like chemotaxis protein
LRLLVVEDEIVQAMALDLFLTDLGHVVVDSVGTEEEAVAAAAHHRPDGILMDIKLSYGGNGLRAAGCIRSSCDIPILFCTAYADCDALKAAVKMLGQARLIGKPFEAESLTDHLHWFQAIREARMPAELAAA